MLRFFSIMLLILRNEGRFLIDRLSRKQSFVRAKGSLLPNRMIRLNGGYCSSSYDNTASSDKNEESPHLLNIESNSEPANSTAPVTIPSLTSSPINVPYSTPSQIIEQLTNKYSYKFQYCQVPHLPNCEFFFCGTLHVADSSVNMVKDVIQTVKPNFVVIELCESRIDGILEDLPHEDEEKLIKVPPSSLEVQNITFFQVLRKSFEEKSIKTLGMGLLTWMQLNAAKLVGSKLGGELTAACYQAYKLGSTVILGDRLYSVTIQRIFDKLTFYEKLKMISIITWEVLTMSLFKLKDYIKKTEDDSSFIKDELDRFADYLPAFANVVINERDEYIAQTLYELANVAYKSSGNRGGSKGRIVVVIGAGHLHGVQKNLASTPFTDEHMREICTSSKHPNTWPGKGVLNVIDMKQIMETLRSQY